MATQTSGFPPIPLNVKQTFEAIRLLEVPDELLEIISQGQDICFKSSPAAIAEGFGKEGNLHLCSNDKIWLVKQVSTSNSLYITRTEAVEYQDDLVTNDTEDTEGGDASMTGLDETISRPQSRLTATSKPTSILELYPIPSSTYENTVLEHLTRLVPALEKSFEDSVPATPPSSYSLADLYTHIPAPTSTITKILSQKVIDDYQDGKAYMPTPSLLLETWKRLVDAVTSSGDIEIDDIFLNDKLLDIAFDNEVYGNRTDAAETFKAIVKNLTKRNGLFEQNDLITTDKNQPPSQMFKAMETARWTGNLVLLAAQEEGVQLDKDAFVSKWEDVVPASWMKYCSIEVLEPACAVVEDEQGRQIVQWRLFTSGNVADGEASQMASGRGKPSAAAGGKNKRKWHEKFAAQRDGKK